MTILDRIKSLLKKTVVREKYVDYVFSKHKSSVRMTTRCESDSLSLLNNFSKCPEGTSECENRILDSPLYDLQIVVSVYRSEKYLRDCVNSIIHQDTKYKIIVFLVNDGSPDNCPEICDEYAGLDSRIKVIHKSNGGLSSSRNAALKEISARYVMFVDSDDRLAVGAIDKLMDKAYANDADIVQGAYSVMRNGFSTGNIGNEKTCKIEYTELMGFPWGKVYRNNLFKNICFPEGFWFEDSINTFLIFPQSKCTWILSDVVYEYRVNYSGLTHSAKNRAKSLDSFWITKLLIQERKNLGYSNDLQYFRVLKNQLKINDDRLSSAPRTVREAVFNLSAAYVTEIFPQVDTLGPLTEFERMFYMISRNGDYTLFSKLKGWI